MCDITNAWALKNSLLVQQWGLYNFSLNLAILHNYMYKCDIFPGQYRCLWQWGCCVHVCVLSILGREQSGTGAPGQADDSAGVLLPPLQCREAYRKLQVFMLTILQRDALWMMVVHCFWKSFQKQSLCWPDLMLMLTPRSPPTLSHLRNFSTDIAKLSNWLLVFQNLILHNTQHYSYFYTMSSTKVQNPRRYGGAHSDKGCRYQEYTTHMMNVHR